MPQRSGLSAHQVNQVEATRGTCDWLPQRWVGRSPFAPAFRRGLHETGYVEGQIVIILGLSFLDTLRRTEHVARGSLWERFDLTAQ